MGHFLDHGVVSVVSVLVFADDAEAWGPNFLKSLQVKKITENHEQKNLDRKDERKRSLDVPANNNSCSITCDVRWILLGFLG